MGGLQIRGRAGGGGRKLETKTKSEDSDFIRAFILGPLPKFSSSNQRNSDLKTVFYHFLLILKQILLHERRKEYFEIPKDLDNSIFEILNQGIEIFNSIVGILIKSSVLNRSMGKALEKALLAKSDLVSNLTTFGDSIFVYEISGLAKLSIEQAFKGYITFSLDDHLTILIDYLMFDLLTHYYELENPSQRQLSALMLLSFAKFDEATEFFSISKLDSKEGTGGDYYLDQFKSHLKFFLHSLHILKRPINYGSLEQIPDKWSIYYSIIHLIRETDCELADSLMRELKSEIKNLLFPTGEPYGSSILESLDFLYEIIHY